MNPKFNPVHKKGDRNVFCPHYNHCLDYVIGKAWDYWGCGHCRQKSNQGARPEFRFTRSDTFDCFDLPTEVYKKS